MPSFYHQLDRETGAWVKKEKQLQKEKSAFLKPLETNKAKGRKKKTEFIGVSFDSRTLLWRAYINIKGVVRSLGLYPTDRQAAIARDHVAIKHGRPTNILKAINA